MGRYSSSLYYGEYNSKGRYVSRILYLTDKMYMEKNGDACDGGRHGGATAVGDCLKGVRFR